MKLGLWNVNYHNINHTVLGIYRAPYSPSNKTTDNQFVDKFLCAKRTSTPSQQLGYSR